MAPKGLKGGPGLSKVSFLVYLAAPGEPSVQTSVRDRCFGSHVGAILDNFGRNLEHFGRVLGALGEFFPMKKSPRNPKNIHGRQRKIKGTLLEVLWKFKGMSEEILRKSGGKIPGGSIGSGGNPGEVWRYSGDDSTIRRNITGKADPPGNIGNPEEIQRKS